MNRLRLIAVAAALVLVPSVAHAQDDSWWAWIERLSGPGPFKTTEPAQIPANWEVRLFCDSKEDQVVHCLSNTPDVNAYVAVRFQLLSTGDQFQFGEATRRDIGLRALEGFVRYRVTPAVDVGSGIGLIWLTDKSNIGFGTQSRGEIIPLSVIIRPAALFGDDRASKRFIGFRVDQAFRFGTITSEQLGGPRGVFETGSEWSFRFAIIADFGVAFR